MSKCEGTGLLVIVSGPSGVGKGSVCAALFQLDPDTVLSVSATTRAPRSMDIEGKTYFFLSREAFQRHLEQNDFLEWAEVYGNFYGTLRSEVERLQREGKNVLLEIDTQGAMQVKAACPSSVSIFILPPSLDVLRQRITGRGTESAETLSLRLSKAEAEIAQSVHYDYRIVNDDIERSPADLAEIIPRQRGVNKEEDCCAE